MEVYVSAFNNATSDFLDDICEAYPHVAVFGLLRTLHSAAAAHDRTIPLSRFEKHVMEKYGDSLRRTDFSFFLGETYDEAPVDNDVVAHIKGLWTDMRPEDRECVKAHLRLLVDIYDKVRSF